MDSWLGILPDWLGILPDWLLALGEALPEELLR